MHRLVARFLGVHSPSAHGMSNCWCKGTKRELIIPGLYTADQAMQDMYDIAKYFDAAGSALNAIKKENNNG
jgi:hypothetical protein